MEYMLLLLKFVTGDPDQKEEARKKLQEIDPDIWKKT